MKRYFYLLLLLGLALCLIFNTQAAAKSLYDDFSGDFIDGSKWRDREHVREVVGGQLVSKVGNNTTNDHVRNTTKFQDPSSINVIECDIIVVATNLDTGTNLSSFARIDGRFYNTLNSGTERGDIYAAVYIGDRGSGLEAWWAVGESLDDEGDSWDDIGTGTLIVPGLTYGNSYTTKIEYDEANGFTFTVAGVSDSFTGPARQAAEFHAYKGLRTGAYSDGGSGTGYASALFDNVSVNNAAYDNFSTAPLDQTKWLKVEEVREIEAGKLRLAVYSDGDKLSMRSYFAGINPYTEASYTEATVTVKSESWINTGAQGCTRIDGYFYNDTYGPGSYNGYEGNVWAQVYIDYYDDVTLEAKCYADRVMDADDTSWQELFDQSFVLPIIVDRPYTLSIHFTGTKLIFTCKDTVTGMKEFAEYQISTPANEPYNNYRGLTSRVYGNGYSGYMAVEFDDVYVDTEQSTGGGGGGGCFIATSAR